MSTNGAILVPTDLSAEAAVAYPFASRWAAVTQRPIRLVYVQEPGDHLPAAGASDVIRRALASIEVSLAPCGQPVASWVREGHPWRELLQDARVDASMLVMGLRGRVGEPHRMMASVAGKLLREVPLDTLLVRAPMLDRPVRRILVPLDLSERSTGAFEATVRLAATFDAALTLVHVAPRPGRPLYRLDIRAEPDEETIDEVMTRAGEELRACAARAAELEVHATTHLAWDDEPAGALVREIRTREPDLVVMASRRRGLTRLVLGSVAERVLRDSPSPVLVVKSHQPSRD